MSEFRQYIVPQLYTFNYTIPQQKSTQNLKRIKAYTKYVRLSNEQIPVLSYEPQHLREFSWVLINIPLLLQAV